MDHAGRELALAVWHWHGSGRSQPRKRASPSYAANAASTRSRAEAVPSHPIPSCAAPPGGGLVGRGRHTAPRMTTGAESDRSESPLSYLLPRRHSSVLSVISDLQSTVYTRLCCVDPGGNMIGHFQFGLRLPALMHLYIHPLYVLVSKILSSILNSSAHIHPLYHSLSTLSTVGLTYHFI
jgi:hypothetical protein